MAVDYALSAFGISLLTLVVTIVDRGATHWINHRNKTKVTAEQRLLTERLRNTESIAASLFNKSQELEEGLTELQKLSLLDVDKMNVDKMNKLQKLSLLDVDKINKLEKLSQLVEKICTLELSMSNIVKKYTDFLQTLDDKSLRLTKQDDNATGF